MTRFIAPVGYSDTPIARPIIGRGVQAGDEVILLAPKEGASPNKRNRSAVDGLRDILSNVAGGINIQVETLPHDDYAASVDLCSRLVVDGKPPVVIFGPGAADVWFPLVAGTFAHLSQVEEIWMFSDVRGDAIEVPVPQLFATVPGRATETFAAIRDTEGQATISDVAVATGQSESTVSRHVQSLEDRGLVTAERAKVKRVSLSLAGRLAARSGAGGAGEKESHS